MTLPRLRIGRSLGSSPMSLVGNLDEIRLTVGARRNLAIAQTAPWPDSSAADSDQTDNGWVDITASRSGYDSIVKRFSLSRARQGKAGVNSAVILIYQRGTSAPALPSAGTVYTFATGILTGLNNGWTTAIPAGVDPLYVSAASASANTDTDTLAAAEWAAAVLYQSNGLSSATIFLFQRNNTGTAPAVPSASTTYTFATGLLSGTLAGWTQTAPAASGGKFLFVTTATALSYSPADTIATGEWAVVQVMAQDGIPGLSNAVSFIYQRATSTPALPTGTATFTFATGATTGLNNGWSAAIPAGTDPLYVSAASASSSDPSDTIAAAEWAAATLYQSNGLSSATIFLFQRNNTGTAPAVPSTSTTYTFATGVLSGTLAGWTQTAPAASGGKFLFVTTATALSYSPTDSITTGEWAAAQVMAQDGLTGNSSALLLIYQRGATAPTLPSGTAVYSFTTQVLTGLNNGWTSTIPEGSNPLYVSAASASSSTGSDTIAQSEWATAALYQKNGLSSATVFLFQRNNTGTAPAVPSASTTYTFATGVLSGSLSGWTQAVPAASGGEYLFVTTAAALSITDAGTIATGEWAAVQIMAQDGAQGVAGLNGTNGTAGANGTFFHVAYATSANGAVGFNQTAGPFIGTYVDTTPADSISYLSYTWRQFQGTDGIAGTDGTNGKTSYLHVKYSNDNGATFTASSGEVVGKYIGTYVDFTVADSDSVGAYTWALIQGADGTNGTNGTDGTNGTNGTNGPRGNINVSRQITGSTWSYPEALLALSAAGYGAPQSRDIVTLYNSAEGFSETRFFDGATWLSVTQYLNGNLFVDGTVAGNKLIAGTVTADYLSSAQGTFTGTLTAARISVGVSNVATTFFDPAQPLIPLQSSAAGTMLFDGPAGTVTYIPATCWVTNPKSGDTSSFDCSYYTSASAVVTGDPVTFKNNSLTWPLRRRIKTGSVSFNVLATGTVDHFFSLWWRRNAGSWVVLFVATEPQAAYGSAAAGITLEINVAANDVIQFGMGPLDAAGNPWNASYIDIRNGQLSVTAANF